MTKEDFEKEAKVYANAIERKASKEIVTIAYMDAAEPREKRITELEKENADLRKQLEQAKEIINQLLAYCVKVEPTDYELICKAEQFVQE